MRNTWVDLTDLFEWKGHFTGIQRVTYNYALRFEKEGARYFVYSKLYRKLIEVPFSLIEEVKKMDDAVTTGNTKRQQVKRKFKSYYKRLPRVTRVLGGPVLRKTNQVFRKFAALVLDRRGRSYIIRKMPTVTFNQGDTVVILGAGWNSGKLIDELTLQTKKFNLNVVLHLNDILPIYQPYLFAEELPKIFAKYTNKALRIAHLVTVISNATKKDIIRYCSESNIRQPVVEVVRLGEDLTSAKPERPSIELASVFILCVGTVEIRKNYILIYQAIKLAESKGITLPQIVIAGRKGWLTRDLQYVIEHDTSVKNKLLILEKMSDANLSWLYENCLFTVFCSLAEGWGLPIAESLQHGKFCLASNTSSMPEIAGDRIDYFNPYDTRECMEKLYKYAQKSEAELSKEIKNSYEVLTWDKSFVSLKRLIELTN